MARSREDDDDTDTLNLSDEVEGEEGEETEEESEEEESEEDPDDPEGEESEESEEEEEPDDRGDAAGADPDAEDEEPDPEDLRRVARGGKAGSVPHARFNEVNEERKRLLSLLERQQAAAQPAAPKKEDPPAFDLKAKIKERNKLLLEGKEDEAAEIDGEIFTHQQQQAANTARAAAAQERDAERLEEVAEAAIQAYPFLNPQSKKHNADALEEVVALRDHYIRKGDKPHAALQKAVDKVGPRYEEEAPPRKGKRDEADDDGEGKGGKKGGEQAKPKKSVKELLKRAGAAARTPPNTRDAGAGNRERNAGTDVDVAEMDEEEYENLPESRKRELRGDTIKSVAKRR